MAQGTDLGRLLAQLRSVSSPMERMKLIARAWRSVRRLGARERNVLARQIGIDGAEELIEGIAVSRGGLNPAVVQRALDRIKEVQPGRLKQTLKDLQDPERRRELIDRGVTAAAEALAGPEEEEPRESPAAIEIEEEEVAPAPSVPEPAAAEPPAPPPPRPEPVRRAPVAPAAAAVSVAAVTAKAAEQKPRPVETVKQRSAPERPAAVTAAELPKTPPREEKREPVAAPVEPAPAPPARAQAPRSTEPAPAAELLRLVGGESMLFRRLRVLRENLGLARETSPEQLRGLLDLFAAGWARRRVVNAMIEGRVPDSLEEAVFLIEQLDSKTDRRWCARTLLREWELSDGERELIASRHGATGSA